MRRKTKTEWLETFKKIHGETYDYSLMKEPENNKEKIPIICSIHGVFYQKISSHANGQGCPGCFRSEKKTTKKFIEEAKEVHGEKYSYFNTKYINLKTKVEIICFKHGSFWQRPDAHLRGQNCPKCRDEKSQKEQAFTTEEFIQRAKNVHGNEYDYSLVNYINNFTKVKIICPIHGIFEQVPYAHLRAEGCPICKKSKGERIIISYLEKNNILFKREKTFDDLKDKNKLRYDFYLPKYNLLIEYNGEQHYRISDFFGGRKAFLKQKHRDWLKRKYARDNGINLLTISYKDDIISKITEVVNE